MKALDVIKQLHYVLPLRTNLFTTNFTISNISVVGDIVTVTTSDAHNLVDNEYVVISSVIGKNKLVSLTQTNEVASAETEINHDLTETFNETVEIVGADQTEYNGEHSLLSTDNRKNFTFEISGNPATPATGTIYLKQYVATYGFNGYKQITLIDANNFSYTADYLFGNYADFLSAEVRTKPRISGAISIDRAARSYDMQNPDDLWAFVVLNDARTSKNRFVLNDATDVQTISTDYRQLIIQNFDILVFKNCKSDMSGRYTRDQMEDLLLPICRTILGVRFPSLVSEAAWAGTTLIGHEFNEYQESYYIHVFRFESVKELTYDDTSLFDNVSVAFRDIDISYLKENDDVKMTSDINLDENPL